MLNDTYFMVFKKIFETSFQYYEMMVPTSEGQTQKVQIIKNIVVN